MKRPLSLTLRSSCEGGGEKAKDEDKSTATTDSKQNSIPFRHETPLVNHTWSEIPLSLLRQLVHRSVTCNIFMVPEFPFPSSSTSITADNARDNHTIHTTPNTPVTPHADSLYDLGQYQIQPCNHDNIILFEEGILPNFGNETTTTTIMSMQQNTFFLSFQSCSVSLPFDEITANPFYIPFSDSSNRKFAMNVSPKLFPLQIGLNGDIVPSIIQASFDWESVYKKMIALDYIHFHHHSDWIHNNISNNSFRGIMKSPMTMEDSTNHESMTRLIHELEQELKRYQTMDSLIVWIGILTFLVYATASFFIVHRQYTSRTRKGTYYSSSSFESASSSVCKMYHLYLHLKQKIISAISFPMQNIQLQCICICTCLFHSCRTLARTLSMNMSTLKIQKIFTESLLIMSLIVFRLKQITRPSFISCIMPSTQIWKFATSCVFTKYKTIFLDLSCTQVGIFQQYRMIFAFIAKIPWTGFCEKFRNVIIHFNPIFLRLSATVDRIHYLQYIVFMPTITFIYDRVLECIQSYFFSLVHFLWFISRTISNTSPMDCIMSNNDDSLTCLNTTLMIRNDNHCEDGSMYPIPSWVDYMQMKFDDDDDVHHPFIQRELSQDGHNMSVSMDLCETPPPLSGRKSNFDVVSISASFLDEASTWTSHDDTHSMSISTPSPSHHDLNGVDHISHREVSIRCEENRTTIIERNSTLSRSPSGRWRRKKFPMESNNDHSSQRDLASSDDGRDEKTSTSPCSRLEKMWKAKLLEKSTEVSNSKKTFHVMNP